MYIIHILAMGTLYTFFLGAVSFIGLSILAILWRVLKHKKPIVPVKRALKIALIYGVGFYVLSVIYIYVTGRFKMHSTFADRYEVVCNIFYYDSFHCEARNKLEIFDTKTGSKLSYVFYDECRLFAKFAECPAEDKLYMDVGLEVVVFDFPNDKIQDNPLAPACAELGEFKGLDWE